MSRLTSYKISISENRPMAAFDVCLEVGGIKTKKDADEFAKVLNEWMQKDSGPDAWSQRIS